jgi:hypothetical protein
MEALILVATRGGHTMLPRIGVMRALNRNVERVFGPTRKEHHWGTASYRGTDDRVPLCQHKQAGRRCRSSQGVRECRRCGKWFEENDPEGVAFEYEVLE